MTTHRNTRRTTNIAERCRRVKLLLFDCDGVLTDGSIAYSNTEEIKVFSARDGIGAALAHRAGLPIGCVTGRSSVALARRAADLGFAVLLQGVADKGPAVAELVAERGLSWSEVAYIGDDLNDLSVLMHAGLSLAPHDAGRVVCDSVHRVLRAVGGRGVVREAIELILRYSNRLEAAQDTFRTGGQRSDVAN